MEWNITKKGSHINNEKINPYESLLSCGWSTGILIDSSVFPCNMLNWKNTTHVALSGTCHPRETNSVQFGIVPCGHLKLSSVFVHIYQRTVHSEIFGIIHIDEIQSVHHGRGFVEGRVKLNSFPHWIFRGLGIIKCSYASTLACKSWKKIQFWRGKFRLSA